MYMYDVLHKYVDVHVHWPEAKDDVIQHQWFGDYSLWDWGKSMWGMYFHLH